MFIDRNFAKRIIELSWPEVKLASSKNWIEAGVAVDRAMQALETENYSQQEAELAALGYKDVLDINDMLLALAPDSYEINHDKWAKIFLTYLYEHKSELEDPIQAIDELWADFDYLESIACIANQYSPYESPQRDLFKEWKKFLDDEVYSIYVEPIQTEN